MMLRAVDHRRIGMPALSSRRGGSTPHPLLRPARRRGAARARALGAEDEAGQPTLFIFGMGYTGRELARQAAARGWRVCGTKTTLTGDGEGAAGGGGGGGESAAGGDGSVQVVRFAPRRDGSDREATVGGADLLW